jgi:hypothetical protein
VGKNKQYCGLILLSAVIFSSCKSQSFNDGLIDKIDSGVVSESSASPTPDESASISGFEDISGEDSSGESWTSIINFERPTNIGKLSTYIEGQTCNLALSTQVSSSNKEVISIADSDWPVGNSSGSFIFQIVDDDSQPSADSFCEYTISIPYSLGGFIDSNDFLSEGKPFTLKLRVKITNFEGDDINDEMFIGIRFPFKGEDYQSTFNLTKESGRIVIRDTDSQAESEGFTLDLSNFIDYRVIYDGMVSRVYVNGIERLAAIPKTKSNSSPFNGVEVTSGLISKGGRITITFDDFSFADKSQPF